MSEQMRQEAKFVFGNEELLAEITWMEGSDDYDIRFMDPQTGWQNSNPSSVQQNWSYQDPDAQQNIRSLINAVQRWEDWTDHLSWQDGGVDIFNFGWDGKTYEGYENEFKMLGRA